MFSRKHKTHLIPKKDLSFYGLIIALLGFQLFFVSCSAEENGGISDRHLAGKVIKVADADTITVLVAEKTQHKVRLEGIDAPERGQAFGTKATDALKGAIGGKPVTVKVSGKDRYGRLIGYVFAGELNLNEWLVENGWAWHYKAYSKDARLDELEKKARALKVGLWKDNNKPMAPWDYRSSKRKQQSVKKGNASVSGYWLNTSANVRHNSACRYYKNTKNGRECESNEGKACGICGG